MTYPANLRTLPRPDDGLCRGCMGDGVLWTECCDGSRGCPCRGTFVDMGTCRVCHGTGRSAPGQNTDANVQAVRARATHFGGYLF